MYRHLTTQDEIDRAYNPRLGVPDVDGWFAGWARRSEEARRKLGGRLGLPYGPTLAEYVDVFPTTRPNAPVHVFLHGGYWRSFSARDFSFIAEGPVARGVCTVVVNYALCPAVPIGEIVRQCRAALAWTWANIAEFGGDRDRIGVSGHSAGGHLTARMLSTAWQRDYGIPDTLIKAALPISGLFDLEPLRWSWLQPALQLSGDEILAQSPMRHLHSVPVPLAVAVGGAESDEFRRQSAEYAAATGAKLMEIEGRHHFDVLDDLASPYGKLWRTVESLMG
ncbi:alpha/beta hydrolase [Azospirillum sp.]|uniref:alpha/beta hydrolase n=1 Tax=Azospirillum sp. TaxID=34012 RepID=UPI003D71B774